MNNVSNQSYSGPERRRHRVFVTRNSEYHCRDGVCVAVRDRKTGEFLQGHTALGRRMSASVRFSPDGRIQGISAPDEAHPGEQLCFSSAVIDEDRGDVITSPLKAVERPPKEVVMLYSN
jgi:hypothetical protein